MVINHTKGGPCFSFFVSLSDPSSQFIQTKKICYLVISTFFFSKSSCGGEKQENCVFLSLSLFPLIKGMCFLFSLSLLSQDATLGSRLQTHYYRRNCKAEILEFAPWMGVTCLGSNFPPPTLFGSFKPSGRFSLEQAI